MSSRVLGIIGTMLGVCALSCLPRTFSSSAEEGSFERSCTSKGTQLAGLCWAYSTTEHLQSEYARNHPGDRVNFSEEALVFYLVAEHLFSLVSKSSSVAEVMSALACEGFSGLANIGVAEYGQRIGFDLASEYGVVPEDVYPVKLKTAKERNDTMAGIKERLAKLLASTSVKSVTMEDLMNNVIVRPAGSQTPPSIFASRPPQGFSWQSRNYSSGTELFKESFGGKAEAVQKIVLKSADDAKRFTGLVKRTLAMGSSVPVVLGLDREHIISDEEVLLLSGENSANLRSSYLPKWVPVKGGPECGERIITEYAEVSHTGLIVDFVNQGGVEGAYQNPVAFAREMEKSDDLVSYFKLQNSCGIDQREKESGACWLTNKQGSYRLDLAYVAKSLAAGIPVVMVLPSAVAAPVER